MYNYGIRFKYLQSGVPCLYSDCCSTKLIRLEYLFKGIKKSEVKTLRKRLPYNIIKDMFAMLIEDCSHQMLPHC